jgi:hypothetical protein
MSASVLVSNRATAVAVVLCEMNTLDLGACTVLCMNSWDIRYDHLGHGIVPHAYERTVWEFLLLRTRAPQTTNTI